MGVIGMTSEISLSLEETNKLRVQLGLKPIIKKKVTTTEEKEDKAVKNEDDISFISKNNARMLRARLNKMNQRLSNGSSSNVNINDDDNDWLNQVNQKKVRVNTNKIRVSHEEDEEDDVEDDLPIMEVAHDVRTIVQGKPTILTLKETSINDDNDEEGDSVDGNGDVLVNEDYVIQEEITKNLKLKTMNKNRRRQKMNLQVGSKDIEETESAIKSNKKDTVVVGAEIQLSEEQDELMKDAPDVNAEGKIRIKFDEEEENDEDEEDDMTDFKPVKIKKRKKKDNHKDSSRKRRQMVKLPTSIKSINLGSEDEDEDEDEESFENRINIIPQRKRNGLSSVRKMGINSNSNEDEYEEDIALIIAKSKFEKEQRIQKLSKSKDLYEQGLTIDETTNFFDSLNSNILAPRVIESREANDNIVMPQNIEKSSPSDDVSKDLHSSNTEDIVPHSQKIDEPPPKKIQPNFYNGLASTLNFLKDNDMLPTKQVSTGDNDNDTKMRNEQKDTSKNISSPISLADYNPEIKLEYKDAKGNKLTSKEAYKKLSQKFHGTKSNKKKQMKFEQKVAERNRRDL